MQILYSYYKSGDKTLEKITKELEHSIDKSYELYLLFLQIPLEVTHYARSVIEKRKQKHLPSPEDLSPNCRFVDNRFVEMLSVNRMLKEKLIGMPVSWVLHEDLIHHFYKIIVNADIYYEYMEAKNNDFEADKILWARIFKLLIFRSEHLGELLEDLSIYWNDDADLVLGMVQKTIKSFQEENGEEQKIMPLFKDKEDETFATKLLSSSIRNEENYRERIAQKTQHWEADRIAFIDKLLMQMAQAEVISFDAIPVKASINEYLDIAKSYSTSKSTVFINGVLDGIIKDLKKEGLVKKKGRGLLE